VRQAIQTPLLVADLLLKLLDPELQPTDALLDAAIQFLHPGAHNQYHDERGEGDEEDESHTLLP